MRASMADQSSLRRMQLLRDQRRDFVRHIRVPGIRGVYSIGPDQIRAVHEPAFGYRVYEDRPRQPGFGLYDVARLQNIVRRVGIRPDRADDDDFRVRGRRPDRI